MTVGWLCFDGLIARPGAPSGEIHLWIGYVMAMTVMLAIVLGAMLRIENHPELRRPPRSTGR